MTSQLELKLCRTCLCTGQSLVDIFSEGCARDFSVQETIQDLLGFRVVQSPYFPWLVCSTCMRKLSEFRLFKQQCLECKMTFESRFMGMVSRIKEEEVEETEGNPTMEDEEFTVEDENIPCKIEFSGSMNENPLDKVPIEIEEAEVMEGNQMKEEGEDFIIDDGNVPSENEPSSNMDDNPLDEMDGNDMKNMGNEENRFCDKTEYTCGNCGLKCCDELDLRVHKCGHDVYQMIPLNVTPKEKTSNEVSSLKWTKAEGASKIFKGDTYSLGLHLSFRSGLKAFKCEICGKNFLQESHLVQHQTVHSDLNPFNCETCGREFRRKVNLMQHLSVHASWKSLKCDICGEVFVRKSILRHHINNHTGLSEFSCEKCGKYFTTKGGLVLHKIVHSGLKAFKCEVCGKMFALKSSLTRHATVHTGLKLFSCKICEQKFGQKCDLVRHFVVHSGLKPFQCETCGQKFARKSNLVQHLAVHSGLKPFQCDRCGQKFGYKFSLVQHLAVHQGLKPYQCKTCGRKYAWKSHLLRHLSGHSGHKRCK